MTTNITVEGYNKQIDFVYKDERYSVRDNGAVFRYTPEKKQPRPTDNKWTFGKLNIKTGYLEIASVRIHRIIATAYYGKPPTKEHVVDHIDTNKQNNRPENLRWVTRLENILLNPITAKRIALICGSVEAFLADPKKFRDKFQEPNFKWMQTVSAEEAQTSKEKLLEWANSEKRSSGMILDDWIFKTGRTSFEVQETLEMVKSETPNAVQLNWTTLSSFPCCPNKITEKPIFSYKSILKIGKTFSRNKYSNWVIAEYAISKDEDKLWVICSATDPTAIKPWSFVQVTFRNNLFVHENLGSFFKQNGAKKYFILAQGLEWTGGDTFDDLT